MGEIEMEFTIELRREVTGATRAKAWVVEAGTDDTRAPGRTHRVSSPSSRRTRRTGRPWKVGNDGAMVDAGDFGTSGCH